MVERYPGDDKARRHKDFRDVLKDERARKDLSERIAKQGLRRFGPRRLAAIGEAIAQAEEARRAAQEKSDRSMPGMDPDLPYIIEPFLPPQVLPERPEPAPSPSYVLANAWHLVSNPGSNYWQSSAQCYSGQDGYKRFTFTAEGGCGGWLGYEQYPPDGTGNFWPMAEPIPDDVLTIQVGHKTTTTIGGGKYRTRHAQRFWRDAAGPVPAPWESVNSLAPTNFVPQDAFQPIAGAQPFDKPNSWAQAVATPGTQPSTKEATKDESKDDPRPRYEVPFLPGVVVYTQPITGAVPAVPIQTITVPETGTDPSVETAPAPATISRRETGTRLKERKLRLRGAAAVAWHVINFLTEGIDFLEVLHEALPKKCRAPGRPPTPYAMSEAIYSCFDQLDLAKAVENYVNNQIEDFYFGLQGRVGAKLNNVSGTFTGGNNALGSGQEFLGEALGETPLKPPEIHFNPDTGSWTIDTPFGTIHGEIPVT